MDTGSFVIGMVAGVGLLLIAAGITTFAWVLKNGRSEFRRLMEAVKLRSDLNEASHQLVDDIEKLEQRQKELGFKAPPRVPSLDERRRQQNGG